MIRNKKQILALAQEEFPCESSNSDLENRDEFMKQLGFVMGYAKAQLHSEVIAEDFLEWYRSKVNYVAEKQPTKQLTEYYFKKLKS